MKDLTDAELAELKRKAEAVLAAKEKATPTPWEWHFQSDRHYQLVHPARGWLVVMDFVRNGMQGGQPRFAVWNGQDQGERRERMGGIMKPAKELVPLDSHPDASYLTLAANSAPDLAAEVLRLTAELSLRREGERDEEYLEYPCLVCKHPVVIRPDYSSTTDEMGGHYHAACYDLGLPANEGG